MKMVHVKNLYTKYISCFIFWFRILYRMGVKYMNMSVNDTLNNHLKKLNKKKED